MVSTAAGTVGELLMTLASRPGWAQSLQAFPLPSPVFLCLAFYIPTCSSLLIVTGCSAAAGVPHCSDDRFG